MARIDLIKRFKDESAEVFNKCSKAYELGRIDGTKDFFEWLYNVVHADDKDVLYNLLFETYEKGRTYGKEETINQVKQFVNTHRYSNDDLILFLEQLMPNKDSGSGYDEQG